MDKNKQVNEKQTEWEEADKGKDNMMIKLEKRKTNCVEEVSMTQSLIISNSTTVLNSKASVCMIF